MTDKKTHLSIVPREANSMPMPQRAIDGYVNATALCKANGKRISHYLENKTTKDFLEALERHTGIPINELVQVKRGGTHQGTWVHPKVAINLGQWISPKLAVLVSKWVVEQISGNAQSKYQLLSHLRRFDITINKIPDTHFSMLDQIISNLLAGLEQYGYILPTQMMLEIARDIMFSKWLRDNGHDPDSYPVYKHEFVDGSEPVEARLYPNELITEFNQLLDNWIVDGRALTYFKERDPTAVASLMLVLGDIKRLKLSR